MHSWMCVCAHVCVGVYVRVPFCLGVYGICVSYGCGVVVCVLCVCVCGMCLRLTAFI